MRSCHLLSIWLGLAISPPALPKPGPLLARLQLSLGFQKVQDLGCIHIHLLRHKRRAAVGCSCKGRGGSGARNG